tara:strand:- start:4396 stop:5943 length:1548 start_codon:yes stop_codon:yes gene_type:complete
MNKFKVTSAIFLVGYFLIALISTPFWRITHDTMASHYTAFLIDQFEYIPYKDIYDQSMPGTYLYHLMIGKIWGYAESALQSFNFWMILIQLGLNLYIFRFMSVYARVASSIIFLLIYISYGLKMSIQRDVVAMTFIISALAITQKKHRLKKVNQSIFLTSVLLGLAATIKPQLAIGLPLFVFYLSWNPENNLKKNIKLILLRGIFGLFSVMLPLFLSIVWVYYQGGQDEFWWMQTKYLPLYLELNANHEYIAHPILRLVTNFKTFLYKIHYWRLSSLILIVGTMVAIKESIETKSHQKKFFWIFNAGLAALYAFTLIISGQYFPYHFMPFIYFAVAPFGVFFETNNQNTKKYIPISIFIISLVTINLTIHFRPEIKNFLTGKKPYITKNGKVDRIIGSLKTHTKKHDTIQVFDWIRGGTVHAILANELKLSTMFFCDHIFKHHLNTKIIKTIINNKLLAPMRKNPPKFILESLTHVHPVGPNTSKDLPSSVREFITKNYNIIDNQKEFILYQRRL